MAFLRALCALTVLLVTAAAPAEVIFQEDFDGYSTNPNFPGDSNDLGGHRTIFGVPSQAAGADSDLWLAGRFEFADSDPITSDVGVLRFASGPAGGPHYNPAGRIDDDAGLVARLDLTFYEDIELSFKWRTFATESNDRLVAAYYVGDDLGAPGGAYDWFNDPNFGNGDMSGSDPQGQANAWYLDNWTEVHRDTSPGGFQNRSGISIPGGGITYIGFWLDNGDHDLGKLDNVLVSGTLVAVPEPSSLTLAALSLLGAGVFAGIRSRRRRGVA